ncbi:MAG: hypothetical protein ACI9MC_001107 [Kiritimatiellia bacterium]|jgi:hypothetical protein
MHTHLLVLTTILSFGCGEITDPVPDSTGWWETGEVFDVQEPIRFTATPYDFPADPSDGIGTFLEDFFPVADRTVEFGPDDQYGSSGCGSKVNRDLPLEIEGVVTIMPRWYMKIDGCNRGDEKYYGNYFIEDSTGGVFIIGDSKVAHFDMGDRVRLRVRGIRTNFDFHMVYAHDVIDVQRGPQPIMYQVADTPFSNPDIGEVRRVRGKVTSEPDTFGQLIVEAEDGTRWFVNYDSELSRRRAFPTVGQTVCATGPIQFSYSEYSLVVMRIGQVAVLQGDENCPD